MFDFLTDEVFQIVVITALFVIGVMLFMLYRRPSENVSQYLDDIDYRIEKMNKKLDELTNTFVNGLMVDEEESDASSVHEEATHEHEEATEEHEEATKEHENARGVRSLNYDGIEFSDIPNFSTDTSVINDTEEAHEEPEEEPEEEAHEEPEEETSREHEGAHEEPQEVNGKKRVNIIKRIIQSEE